MAADIINSGEGAADDDDAPPPSVLVFWITTGFRSRRVSALLSAFQDSQLFTTHLFFERQATKCEKVSVKVLAARL